MNQQLFSRRYPETRSATSRTAASTAAGSRRRSVAATKRSVDLLLASVLLLVLSPQLALIAIAIRAESAGPVLHRDRRVGRNGRHFTMYKFRSMYAGAHRHRDSLLATHANPSHPFMLADDPRVTAIGRVLRKTSLDELPQLWSVVRGDMSLVGPRPLLPYDLDHAPAHADAWKELRATVRPGLTGRWQIRTRYLSDPPHDQMIEDDCNYVRSLSLRRDLRILVRTPLAMVSPLLRRSVGY